MIKKIGNGHTLFKLNERFRCSGLGVSLSHKEIEFAQSIVVNKGKAEEIDFKRMSYDTDFQKSFDKIFAIESIKHSTDLNYTIKNLWNQLSMNGYLIIADDFLLNGKKYLTQQSSFWESPGFVSLIEFFKILKEQTDLREEQIQNINLTPFVPTRNIWLLRLLFGLINPLLTLLPEKRSTNVKTYLGGILLELGYVNSDVSYNLLIIHKK